MLVASNKVNVPLDQLRVNVCNIMGLAPDGATTAAFMQTIKDSLPMDATAKHAQATLPEWIIAAAATILRQWHATSDIRGTYDFVSATFDSLVTALTKDIQVLVDSHRNNTIQIIVPVALWEIFANLGSPVPLTHQLHQQIFLWGPNRSLQCISPAAVEQLGLVHQALRRTHAADPAVKSLTEPLPGLIQVRLDLHTHASVYQYLKTQEEQLLIPSVLGPHATSSPAGSVKPSQAYIHQMFYWMLSRVTEDFVISPYMSEFLTLAGLYEQVSTAMGRMSIQLRGELHRMRANYCQTYSNAIQSVLADTACTQQGLPLGPSGAINDFPTNIDKFAAWLAGTLSLLAGSGLTMEALLDPSRARMRRETGSFCHVQAVEARLQMIHPVNPLTGYNPDRLQVDPPIRLPLSTLPYGLCDSRRPNHDWLGATYFDNALCGKVLCVTAQPIGERSPVLFQFPIDPDWEMHTAHMSTERAGLTTVLQDWLNTACQICTGILKGLPADASRLAFPRATPPVPPLLPSPLIALAITLFLGLIGIPPTVFVRDILEPLLNVVLRTRDIGECFRRAIISANCYAFRHRLRQGKDAYLLVRHMLPHLLPNAWFASPDAYQTFMSVAARAPLPSGVQRPAVRLAQHVCTTPNRVPLSLACVRGASVVPRLPANALLRDNDEENMDRDKDEDDANQDSSPMEIDDTATTAIHTKKRSNADTFDRPEKPSSRGPRAKTDVGPSVKVDGTGLAAGGRSWASKQCAPPDPSTSGEWTCPRLLCRALNPGNQDSCGGPTEETDGIRCGALRPRLPTTEWTCPSCQASNTVAGVDLPPYALHCTVCTTAANWDKPKAPSRSSERYAWQPNVPASTTSLGASSSSDRQAVRLLPKNPATARSRSPPGAPSPPWRASPDAVPIDTQWTDAQWEQWSASPSNPTAAVTASSSKGPGPSGREHVAQPRTDRQWGQGWDRWASDQWNQSNLSGWKRY